MVFTTTWDRVTEFVLCWFQTWIAASRSDYFAIFRLHVNLLVIPHVSCIKCGNIHNYVILYHIDWNLQCTHFFKVRRNGQNSSLNYVSYRCILNPFISHLFLPKKRIFQNMPFFSQNIDFPSFSKVLCSVLHYIKKSYQDTSHLHFNQRDTWLITCNDSFIWVQGTEE